MRHSVQTMAVPDTTEADPESNLSERLQGIVTGWQGAERGQALGDLHQQCQDVAAFLKTAVLPSRLVVVPNLDGASLREALKQQRIRGDVRFRVPPIGRFDAALVPVGPANKPADRWVFALGTGLSPREKVALYAHALAHLLLNQDTLNLGLRPPLNPRDGYVHADTLEELRLIDSTRSPVNARVLDTYPRLASLLHPVADLPLSSTRVTSPREKLAAWGWKGSLVVSPYEFTDGRVYVSGDTIRRGPTLRADALLRAEASLPIAVVRARRGDEGLDQALQRLEEQARRLLLPFAYLVEDDGTVHELETGGTEVPWQIRRDIPARNELLHRWLDVLGLDDERARTALTYPYNISSGRKMRYYQESAVNRAVAAVLQARDGKRAPRVLLTMATGTGKTYVAFQIVWKLKRTRSVSNVLFLTDRDFLLGQAMDNDFAPFGDARSRIRGEVETARDVLFATYQAIADEDGRPGLFRRYPRDFFDLVIIDECHRGSAQDESNWRSILDHFDGAIHIGLTATPLRTDNVRTYRYFGEPVAIYSLRDGISDGFLAPYRVRRVLMSDPDSPEDGGHGHAQLDIVAVASNEPLVPASFLVANTDVIARHIAAYLRETDPMAKTIVFCVDQQHAQDMRHALRRECAATVERYPGYIERIVADEGEDGKRVLGRFGTPDEKLPVIVTTSRLLTTGVDVPTCKNIVLARPVSSMVEFKQIIGRGTRLFPPGKTWFTIVDYAGATHHFFDPEFDGDPETVDVTRLQPEPAANAEPAAVQVDVATERQSQGGEDVVEAGPIEAVHGTDGTMVRAVREHGGPLDEDGSDRPLETSDRGEVETPEEPIEYPMVGGKKERTHGTADDESQASEQATLGSNLGTGAPRPSESSTVTPIPLTPGTPLRQVAGRSLSIRGEYIYELAPDGKTLRPLANYAEYASDALASLRTTPSDLRQRWSHEEQREEILGTLRDAGIDLRELARVLRQPDADPLDLLSHVTAGTPVRSRQARAERLRQRHAAFFDRFPPEVRAILEAVLEKYVRGEVQEEKDVNDVGLLKVPPLSQQGTLMELVTRLGGGDTARAALQEMQRLLYED